MCDTAKICTENLLSGGGDMVGGEILFHFFVIKIEERNVFFFFLIASFFCLAKACRPVFSFTTAFEETQSAPVNQETGHGQGGYQSCTQILRVHVGG